MKNTILICLLLCIVSFMPAEMLFNINTGWQLHSEKEKSSDSRFIQGPRGIFDFTFYPGSSFVGFFVRNSVSVMIDPDDNIGIAYDFGVGPSFIWRINQHINTVFSAGPMYAVYVEPESQQQSAQSYIRRGALELGLLGDVAVMFKTGNRFFFKAGLTGNWTFFRAESKLTQKWKNNEIYIIESSDLKKVDYQRIGLVPYLGIGLGFLY